MTHVWALAKLRGGGEQFCVLTVSDVEKVQSQSKASQHGPWKTHWEEMAKKTAIRRLCKYLPLSDDDFRLIELAGKEEAGIPQGLQVADVIDVPASATDAGPEKPPTVSGSGTVAKDGEDPYGGKDPLGND